MFSHYQILINPKSYGLDTMSVSRTYVFAVGCIVLKAQPLTAVSAVLS